MSQKDILTHDVESVHLEWCEVTCQNTADFETKMSQKGRAPVFISQKWGVLWNDGHIRQWNGDSNRPLEMTTMQVVNGQNPREILNVSCSIMLIPILNF